MRQFPQYDSDWVYLRRVNAPDWMIQMLKCNPSYPHWGPREDEMGSGKGWSAPLLIANWSDHEIVQDDYNEVVHFYFQIERASAPCDACAGSGYNREVKQLFDDWYDHAGTGRRWANALEQVEVDALWEARRLSDFETKPTADEVNAWSRTSILGHDGINKSICVKARAKARGILTTCSVCEETGYVFVEPAPRLALVYWLCHPRKGASRGVEIANINRSDLPEVKAFLNEACMRGLDRFSGVDLIPD
jgi:hypothetical protein